MPPKKPDRPQDPLSEAQREALEGNRIRYKKHELTLTTVVETVEKIGEGHPRALELLELNAVSMLSIVRRQELEDRLKAEAGRTWTALNEHVRPDENGNPSTTFSDMEALLGRLAQPRAGLIKSHSRLAEPRYLHPKDLKESLQITRPLASLPETIAKPFDPDTEKDTYLATTSGKRTESGRQAIQNTLTEGRSKVSKIARGHLERAVVYNQIVLISLMRLQQATAGTTDEVKTAFEMMSRGETRAALEGVFDIQDIEKQAAGIAKLGSHLTDRIEFILAMMEQESGVSDILATMIPSEKLGRLRKKINDNMSEGPDKSNALRVVEEAMSRRNELRASHHDRQIPDELSRKLEQIDFLGLEIGKK